MKFAVVVFPGSNCDHDAYHAAKHVLGHEAEFVGHKETSLGGADVVILPGGFSYGDYLRTGAIAQFSPVMSAVRAFAARGGPVLGICNGFQILCEAHLLPGALLRNARLTFVSKPVLVTVEHTGTPFTSAYQRGATLRLPVAHGDGRFVADPETIAQREAEGRVVLRYARDEDANPNGSMHDIAGIASASGNVVGIMPHPERAAEPLLGNEDGAGFFTSMAAWTGAAAASHSPDRAS